MVRKKSYPPQLIIVLLMCLLFSCEEKTSWNLESSGQFLVIDALITNEFKTQKIRVTRPYTDLNGDPEVVSGINITVSENENTYIFNESEVEPGIYYSSPFKADAGKTYKLTISYNAFTDSAFAQMATVSAMNAFNVTAQNKLYKFNYTGSSSAAMTEVYYNWSAVDTFCTWYGACGAMETYYTINTYDVSKEFGPPRQNILFPAETQIIRRKYSLTEAHQNFIRSLLIETEWRGGIFDVEQGNIPTNFKNGSRGWFAVCEVLSDTTTVE
ncbi:DUF4249 family protein [Saccharicrinis sp. FJH54]|uniref:DUF4249 family protein n=1 Tax=Saccharicrinis sp. FJH54 TaxID=3344665 RepID=UPI0035D477EE